MIIYKNKGKSFTPLEISNQRVGEVKNRKLLTGFTLIELLVVIAIITLISSLVLVNLMRAKERARDARRLQEINQIVKLLEFYFADYGQYPVRTCPCGAGDWETSDVDPGQFMEYLKSYTPTIPVDPVNRRVEGFSFFGPRPGNYFYAYYRYTTPYGPCPEIKNPFAVMVIINLEAYVSPDLPEEGMPLPPNITLSRAVCGDPGPDGICTVDEYHAGQCRDWSQEFDYSIMLRE